MKITKRAQLAMRQEVFTKVSGLNPFKYDDVPLTEEERRDLDTMILLRNKFIQKFDDNNRELGFRRLVPKVKILRAKS